MCQQQLHPQNVYGFDVKRKLFPWHDKKAFLILLSRGQRDGRQGEECSSYAYMTEVLLPREL